MKISVKNGDICEGGDGVCIVGHILDDEQKLGGATLALDKKLDGEIAGAILSGEFSGKKESVLVIRSRGRVGYSHVIVVGEGKVEDLNVEVVRGVIAAGMKKARDLKAERVSCVLLGAGLGGLEVSAVGGALAEGAFLGLYEYKGWKKDDEDDKAVEIGVMEIVEIEDGRVETADIGVGRGVCGALAQIEARDLVNMPPSSLFPADLRDKALELAESSDKISVTILDREAAREAGMMAFLAVAQGSEAPPYFIHLVYSPESKAERSLALVGKGVTFDSGGLSLKPAKYMETMKCDMAGAASVLGVFSGLDLMAPDVEVHGIIAAAENMPGANAYRPGDVVVAKNGVSIEVLNTDAEGRITLADALSYASDLKPDAIIDMATLTGACVVALGEEIVGVMSDDDDLTRRIFEAGVVSGEELWQLPLFKGYEKLIESKVADVKNIGNQWGGTLTAGLFLKKFVEPEIPWMHLDIAGPAYAERDYLSYVPYGGTGVIVRTLLEVIRKF